jgi:hypothetical protein
MQLYSKERAASHSIEGHAAELKLNGHQLPTRVFFTFAVRTAVGAKVRRSGRDYSEDN